MLWVYNGQGLISPMYLFRNAPKIPYLTKRYLFTAVFMKYIYTIKNPQLRDEVKQSTFIIIKFKIWDY